MPVTGRARDARIALVEPTSAAATLRPFHNALASFFVSTSFYPGCGDSPPTNPRRSNSSRVKGLASGNLRPSTRASDSKVGSTIACWSQATSLFSSLSLQKARVPRQNPKVGCQIATLTGITTHKLGLPRSWTRQVAVGCVNLMLPRCQQQLPPYH